MIGREREVGEVIDRLAARRLVTLTGPGGIGKTTVARAVVDAIGKDFELGAHVVDLTRVDTPADVAGTLAAQLGFASFDALLDTPSEQPALLLVDNCEHVIAAAAAAIGTLLAACSAPRVLATSRSPLDVPGESLVVLGPLDLPAPGSGETTDASQLFLERARDAGTEIAAAELVDVATLCRRLDGVPLAIELAAARTRTMRPAEILAHLDKGYEGVDVLARPRFRGSARHRSLTATIEWSYRLLPPDAATLFDRLGASAGQFDAALVSALGTAVGLRGAAVTDALQVLVDASLVVDEPSADHTRFRLLETVRGFAVRRLDEQGMLDEVRGQVADHVVAEALELLSVGGSRWEASVFARLGELYDHVVAALRNCLARDADGGRGLVLYAVLWGVVHQRHTAEIAALGEDVLARWPDLRAPFAADAVATLATARCLLGEPTAATSLAERALAEATLSPTAAVTLRRAMAYAARALGDRRRALELLEEVARRAREQRLLALAHEAEATIAQLLGDDGRLDVAIARAADAAAEAIAVGSAGSAVWARSVGANLRARQDLDAGIDEAVAALADAGRIDYSPAIILNLRTLAWARSRGGDQPGAAQCVHELWDALVALDGMADLRGALLSTAAVLRDAGDPAWAPLAATGHGLPLTGPTGVSVDELLALPAADAAPLSRRDAIELARDRVGQVIDAGRPAGPESSPVTPEPGPADAVDPVDAAAASLIDRGDFWEITFDGSTVHVKASKALDNLATLLGAPGREIHCLDLIGAAAEEASLGETIDATARRRYEARIRELQEDLDEADRYHDIGRSERVQAELDALVDQLSAAVGLGGRGRRTGGSAERARSAVTHRIRSMIRRLAREHPPLGRHLEASVSTGTYCVYRPERPVTWRR